MIKLGKKMLSRFLKLLGFKLVRIGFAEDKYDSEISYWKYALERCRKWYSGEGGKLWGIDPPDKKEKVKADNETESVVKTWLALHQHKKYLIDLKLKKNSFKCMKLLDIGCGPYPCASIFKDSELYCLDPLLPEYIKAGYPIHCYDNVKFVYGYSENMPFLNNYFDAIISVNALDHVDNFEVTAEEIKRVLKLGGKVRFHLHYHKRHDAEPIELTDDRVIKAFSWCKDFKKISESSKKSDYILENKSEKYVIWSNF